MKSARAASLSEPILYAPGTTFNLNVTFPVSYDLSGKWLRFVLKKSATGSTILRIDDDNGALSVSGQVASAAITPTTANDITGGLTLAELAKADSTLAFAFEFGDDGDTDIVEYRLQGDLKAVSNAGEFDDVTSATSVSVAFEDVTIDATFAGMGATGPQGDRGPAGDTGPEGPAGPAGNVSAGGATDINGIVKGDGSELAAATAAEVREALDAGSWDAVFEAVGGASARLDFKLGGVVLAYLTGTNAVDRRFQLTSAARGMGTANNAALIDDWGCSVGPNRVMGFTVTNSPWNIPPQTAWSSVEVGVMAAGNGTPGDASATVKAAHFETQNVIPETTWAMGTNWTDNGDGTYTSTNATGYNGITSPTLTLEDAGLYRLTLHVSLFTSGALQAFLGTSGVSVSSGDQIGAYGAAANRHLSWLFVRQPGEPATLHLRGNNGFEGTIGEITLNRIA